ncbi:MAG TPA: helix-turn-helix transcriptional regulator [Bryobacteraceae bacterium]|jgi:transcriptional regulator with XRE-family HTH domain|nr:helix-turn-helix transcriptional regulator [Bryobacteraceae bacterium]
MNPYASLTRVGQMILESMGKCNLSIKDLAIRMDFSYEHIRRIVRGEGVPSKPALRMICQELGIEFAKADRLATADRMNKKFGEVPAEISKKKPGMEPLERLWDDLRPGQQQDLIAMAQLWFQRNKDGAEK